MFLTALNRKMFSIRPTTISLLTLQYEQSQHHNLIQINNAICHKLPKQSVKNILDVNTSMDVLNYVAKLQPDHRLYFTNLTKISEC